MTTDHDIVRALEGKPSNEEQARLDSLSEALGHEPERRTAEETLPLEERSDDLEAIAIWAAKEAASVATRELAEPIMRADGGKNIYAAEWEASKSLSRPTPSIPDIRIRGRPILGRRADYPRHVEAGTPTNSDADQQALGKAAN